MQGSPTNFQTGALPRFLAVRQYLQQEPALNANDQPGVAALAGASQNPSGIKWAPAKSGALGAVNTFTENPGLPDGRQWKRQKRPPIMQRRASSRFIADAFRD